MISSPRRLPLSRHHATLGLLALAGAALAVWSFADAQRREREQTEAMFVRRANVRHTLAREVLGRYEDALFGLSTLFMVDRKVTRHSFLLVASRLQERTAGALALQWVPRVPREQRAEVEATLQRSYSSRSFEFREPDASGQMIRAADRPVHLPIAFIHPMEANERALGFDLMTGPTRDFLERARTTRRITLTGPISLVQAPAGRPGVVMIAPVWRANGPDAPPESEVFEGYVQAVFLADDLLERTRIGQPDTILDMLYIDASEPDPAKRVLYYRPADDAAPRIPEPTETEFRHGLHQELRIPIGGREWRVLYRPTPGWVEAQSTPLRWVRTGGVIALTLLLGGLIHSLWRRAERIEREVRERTAELAESRRELDTLLHALPGAAFRCVFDEQLTALFVSEGMQLLTGYPPEEFIAGQRHISQLTVPADRAAVRAGVADGISHHREFVLEYRILHREGMEKWILVRGRPIYAADGSLRFIEGLAIDVTALKQAEQEKIAIERKLFEGQKLESLGVMAGGVAHDFNNILTSVLVNASLARQLPAAEAVGTHLGQIESAARRAAELCQQLLAYTGKGKLVTERVNLNELVRGITTLLEVTIAKSIRLELQLADSLPPVLADLTQLRQIVMNLVINAADAIGENPGLITVRTFTQPVDSAQLRQALSHPELPAGDYAGLEVSDNGCGMTPETIAKIFEPFYSTKFSGRGLGLAAVQGIVKNHQGALFVESRPGAGSIFRLLFPTTDGPAVSSQPPFSTPAGSDRLSGLVLLVDDEESVRTILGAALESRGATVLPAARGEEALELLRTQGDRVALVLLDMTMPGLSGEETLRRLRQSHAGLPVIVMSGYSEAVTMQRTTDLGVAGFVQKPFELGTLFARVKPFLG